MFSDFFLVFVLILVNGFFAAAEIAVVSSREPRLQTQADGGNKRAARALNLKRKPGEFLATVQVGITLVATMASAVGGVNAAAWLGPQLAQISWLAPYAEQVALGTLGHVSSRHFRVSLTNRRLAGPFPAGFSGYCDAVMGGSWP